MLLPRVREQIVHGLFTSESVNAFATRNAVPAVSQAAKEVQEVFATASNYSRLIKQPA
jgi:hypothetical protein